MGKAHSESARDALKINAVIFVLALSSLAASLSPQWRLWGLDSFAVFPLWLRMLLLAVLLVVSIPSIADRLGQSLKQGLASLSTSRGRVLYLLLVAAMLALYVLLSYDNLLLGDGYNIRGNIAAGKTFSFTEPLDYFVHHLVFTLTKGGTSGAHLSYTLCSYAAGILFLLGLLAFTYNFSDLLITFATAITFAAMQFFFGYVESYTFAFVCSFLYLVSARADIEKKTISVVTILMLALAMAFHLSSVVLIPSFIVLLLKSTRSKATLASIAFLLLLAAAAGIFHADRLAKLEISEMLVPLSPTVNNPYHLFCSLHIRDLTNLLLLDFPLLILIPFLWRFSKPEWAWFYLAAILPALIFTFVVDPKLGALRDWDLLSVATAPIMAFLAAMLSVWRRASRGGALAIIVPLLTFAFVHTGGWLVSNMSRQASFSKMKKYVQEDVHYSKGYFKAYRNKSWASIASTMYNDVNEAIRAGEVRYAGDPMDSSNTPQLAYAYLFNGDTSKAVDLAMSSWKDFVYNPSVISSLGTTLTRANHRLEAKEIYQKYMALGGAYYKIVYDLGAIYEQNNQLDSAFLLYDLAYRSWPNPSIVNELAFYLSVIQYGYFEMAQNGLRRIKGGVPLAERPLVEGILKALPRGSRKEIDPLVAALCKRMGIQMEVIR